MEHIYLIHEIVIILINWNVNWIICIKLKLRYIFQVLSTTSDILGIQDRQMRLNSTKFYWYLFTLFLVTIKYNIEKQHIFYLIIFILQVAPINYSLEE